MIYSYKIHVINRDLNLDASYKNVVQVFNPLTHTKDYSSVFTSDELTFTDADVEINFDINDGINSSVVLDLEDAESEDAHVLKQFGVTSISASAATNRQYCIVQEVTKNDNLDIINTKLYFYFIIGGNIRNGNIIKYNLQLDAFMTYPLFSDISVNKTRISRAHVNRFTYGATPNNATHNLNLPYLQKGEPFDDVFAKVRKEIIETNYEYINGGSYEKIEGSDTISADKIKEIVNSTFWLYINKQIPNGELIKTELYIAPYLNKYFIINGYKTNITFYVSTDTTEANFKYINASLLYNKLCEDANVFNAFISPFGFLGSNTNTTNKIAYKYDSVTHQLQIIFVCPNYQIDNLQEISGSNTKPYTFLYATTEYAAKIGFANDIDAFMAYFETANITLFETTNSYTNTPFNYSMIQKAEIKTKLKQCYNEYILRSEFDNAEVSTDLTILKTNQLKIKVLNNISNMTNGEIYATLNNIYEKDFGIFTKTQFTPVIFSDKFNEYKATNRNYAITGQAIPLLTGTAAGAAAGAKMGGIYGGVAGAVVGFGAAAVKVYTNYDDMKNAPDAIKLKGQNAAIDSKIKTQFINIEHKSLKEEELKAVNMYFYEYGYTIDEVVEMENFFGRSSFNYIQTENCEKDLHALINKNVLDVIIKALNNGVRFWTPEHYATSKFEYTTNNLENALNA